MAEEIKLEVLPSGHIKFKRGDKVHNDKMRKIILSIIECDEKEMATIDHFFNGSEDVNLLVGETILCG